MASKNSSVTQNGKNGADSKAKMLRNPDDTLWRQVKAQAALEGVTLTQWVEEAIRIRLAKERSD